MFRKRNQSKYLILFFAVILSFAQIIPSFGASSALSERKPDLKFATAVQESYIQLRWGKMTGVTGYQIYRSIDRENGFKKIASLKEAASYIDRKVVSKYYLLL